MSDPADRPKVERILCTGGPHGDFYHEVEYGWPIPERMGLPDDDGVLRYYDVVDGVARYSENQERMSSLPLVVWREVMEDDVTSLGFFPHCPACGAWLDPPDSSTFDCPKCGRRLMLSVSPED